MLAEIDPGTATVVVAVIAAIVAPTWLQWLSSRKRDRELKGRLDTVDKAVNNVKEGEPSLIMEVKTMRRDVDHIKMHDAWKGHVLERVAQRVGVPVQPFEEWKAQLAAQAKENDS
jgi:type II secretory pathway pseudopilin PulG